MEYADVETRIAVRLHERLNVKTWADPELPGDWNYRAPIVHVQRAPGEGDIRLTLDAALLDIDVYAAHADNARAVAEQVRTEMRLHLPQHTWPDGLFCTGVTTFSGPAWVQGASPPQRTATYRVVLHGLI